MTDPLPFLRLRDASDICGTGTGIIGLTGRQPLQPSWNAQTAQPLHRNAVDPEVILDSLWENLKGFFLLDTIVPVEVFPVRYPIIGSALEATIISVDSVEEHIEVSARLADRSSEKR